MFDSEFINCFCTCLMFQYFVEAGAIAVKRVRKEDMRHIAKATGATMVSSRILRLQNLLAVQFLLKLC